MSDSIAKKGQALAKKYPHLSVDFKPANRKAKPKKNPDPQAQPSEPKTRKPRAKKDPAEPKKPKAKKPDLSMVLVSRKPEKNSFAVISLPNHETPSDYREYTVDLTFCKNGSCRLSCTCPFNSNQHKACKHVLTVTGKILGLAHQDLFEPDEKLKNWPLGSKPFVPGLLVAKALDQKPNLDSGSCYHCGCSGPDKTCQGDCSLSWHESCRLTIEACLGKPRLGPSDKCYVHRDSGPKKEEEQEPRAKEPEPEYDPDQDM